MRLGKKGVYTVNPKGVKNALEIEVTALREIRSKLAVAIGRLKLEEKILRAALLCLKQGQNDRQTPSSASASTEADVDVGGSDSDCPSKPRRTSKRSREEGAENDEEEDTSSQSSGDVRETLAKRRRSGGCLVTGKIHKIGHDTYTVVDPNERLTLEWTCQAEREEMAAGNLADVNVSEIDALVDADKSEGLEIDNEDAKTVVTDATRDKSDVDVDRDLALVEEVDALLREID